MRAAVQHVFQGKSHFASDGVDHLCLEIGQAGDNGFGQTLVALGVGQYLGVSSAVGGDEVGNCLRAELITQFNHLSCQIRVPVGDVTTGQDAIHCLAGPGRAQTVLATQVVDQLVHHFLGH